MLQVRHSGQESEATGTRNPEKPKTALQIPRSICMLLHRKPRQNSQNPVPLLSYVLPALETTS